MRVLITGANRGFGLGLVRACLARGDLVHAATRQPDAEALRALGPGLVVHPLDITDEDSCRALARNLGDEALDLLVNNAGIGGRYNPGLEELDLGEALRVYDTNALGTLRVTRALLPHLRRSRGKVVHVTSLMGSMADNRSGLAYAYRMSKAALHMASTNLALELRAQGVLSVVVNPGWVRTDMGGPRAPTTVETACAQIVALCDRLTLDDTGRFFSAAGAELPW
jgi:NAD(P)-dependent dehydrogenase (short-subunit alcohol dehydrogenase family)